MTATLISSLQGSTDSPPRRGGVAATLIKILRSFLYWSGRGGQSGETVQLHRTDHLLRLRAFALALRARLRRFGGFAAFSGWRSHPCSARRGMSVATHLHPYSTAMIAIP